MLFGTFLAIYLFVGTMIPGGKSGTRSYNTFARSGLAPCTCLTGTPSMVETRLRYPILLSILAALATLGLKSAAYALTDSVGLLSDAVESLVNLVAALTAYLSLHYAARPVDASHTYGHEKIEFFSSGLEGVLIVVAAVAIAWYAVRRLLIPEVLSPLGPGLSVALAASVLNGLVAFILLRSGRRYGSIVLEANGRHLLTDVWTSAGVLAGLGLVWLTNIYVLDPLIALGVSVNILWTGFDLIRRSFDGLMDHALPESEQAAVRSAIETRLGPHMDYHALRTRQAGRRRFVDFHLLMPGRLTVQEAHGITGTIEDAVRTVLPEVEVTVHIEPIEDSTAWGDSALLPLEQARRAGQAEGTRHEA
jgi:cation diffusion facilitator family transporter